MILNEIDNALIGNTQVSEIYLGNYLVWPTEVPPTPPVPQAIHSPLGEIWYTTQNNTLHYISDNDKMIYGIVSNTYVNGKGVIKYDFRLDRVPNILTGAEDITSVYYPDTQIIDTLAFSGCNNIKRINCDTDGVIIVGDNVEVIRYQAFLMEENTNIKTMILGSNLKSVAVRALGCWKGNLTKGTGFNLYCYAKTEPVIQPQQLTYTTSYDIVYGQHKETFHYPAGSDYSFWTSKTRVSGLGYLEWTCLADL